MANQILEGLNPQQKKAVAHDQGPMLIIAGAGTGKTTVITRRIAHLIVNNKVRPDTRAQFDNHVNMMYS